MKPLPDIQSSKLFKTQMIPLNWVGVENVSLPIQLFHGQPWMSARLSAGVNLTSLDTRGIHMSRLYTLLEKKIITKAIFDSIEHLMNCHLELIQSQDGLASAGQLEIKLDYSYHHKSLASGQTTQRLIPLELKISGDTQSSFIHISFNLIYSSTCPQSYALATQSTVEAFQKQFEGCDQVNLVDVTQWLQKGLVATPHAQRSVATIELSWPTTEFDNWMRSYKNYHEGLKNLISRAEEALGTPSQSLVKRVDEKKFAELNAAHTMFCEDAARRLYEAFDLIRVPQFFGKVRHFESLHPFDVMAQFGKTLQSVDP
jgi:GTP cyclohydrolase I